MKKRIIISIILTLPMINPLFSAEFEKLWGVSRTDLINRLKLENYSSFKPDEKPEYRNKIIEFFYSMNQEERAVITIIRTHGNHDTDYCFFNEKLYSISEDWGYVNRTSALNMLKTLKEKYSEISTEEKNSNIIYSFKKDKTKVLLYEKVTNEKLINIRIFYYSIDLFDMLLSE